MNQRRPIWGFLAVVVFVWLAIIAAWFGVRTYLPGLEDRLILAIGILVGVIATLDRLWKYFKSSAGTASRQESGAPSTTVDIGGNVEGDVMVAEGDIINKTVHGDEVGGDKYETHIH